MSHWLNYKLQIQLQIFKFFTYEILSETAYILLWRATFSLWCLAQCWLKLTWKKQLNCTQTNLQVYIEYWIHILNSVIMKKMHIVIFLNVDILVYCYTPNRQLESSVRAEELLTSWMIRIRIAAKYEWAHLIPVAGVSQAQEYKRTIICKDTMHNMLSNIIYNLQYNKCRFVHKCKYINIKICLQI